jgi:hypothetical protein
MFFLKCPLFFVSGKFLNPGVILGAVVIKDFFAICKIF